MKCLNCRTNGRHFFRKICDTCLESGVHRDDIKITKHSLKLVGANLYELVSDVIGELKDRNASYSHFNGTFKEHSYDNKKNELVLKWNEYERIGAPNGNQKANQS